jgi:MFS family permease
VTAVQQRVLWTAGMSHALIHVYELAIPALLILIQAEFGTGDFAMGRVVTLYGLLFGVGALPAGWLVDHVGSKRLLLACLWGSALCMAGMAAAPSLGWFAAGAGCMGLCLSIYHPAGTALISHSLPVSGRLFAVHGMAGNLGVAGSAVLAGSLGTLFGWRWAVGSLSMLGFALGLAVLSLPVPALHDVRERPGRGHAAGFALLLVAAGFLGMVYRGMTTFLPKLFATRYAEGAPQSAAVSGLLTTLAMLVGLAGMFVAGRTVDRGMPPVRAFLVGAVVQAPFLVLVGWVAGPALVAATMAVAFFHFFTQPPANHMVADFTPPRLRGLGYGIYFFVVFGAGSLGASFGGWISERYDLALAFPALAVLAVPAVAATIALAVALRGARNGGTPSSA